jgi:hypothetical protein
MDRNHGPACSGTGGWHGPEYASWIAGFRGRQYQAAVSATIALVFIVLFLFRSTMSYPLYEREPIVPIVGHGLGYWLWMLSAATMVIGYYRALIEHKPSLRKSEAP